MRTTTIRCPVAFVVAALAILAGSTLLSSSALAQADAEPVARERPHIVVIVSDDAGYADFSMHGATDLATPRIDSIARNGIRFSNGYVSGAVCSPTRAGLMTGRYQQRFGHEFNIPPRFSEENGLPVEETTLADMLHGVGYRTIALGKWHLGYADKFHPLSRGFDHYFGFLQGARSFYPLDKPTRLNRLLRDREVVPETFEYMTDELAAQAVKYIDERGKEPLFLYVAFNAVHTPMHALEKDMKSAAGKPKRKKLIGMTRALDRAIGTILDGLERAEILNDTLLFFVNDNGGATNNASSNAPLRGRKGQLWEGGIRVPFLVQWPNGLPAGNVVDEPVIALDIAATACAVAGAEPAAERPLDGVDLLSVLTGEQEWQERALYWRHGDNWAIRRGRWKLVQQGDMESQELYDLEADPGETVNRASENSSRVVSLRRDFTASTAGYEEPRWRFGKRRK